MTEPEALFLRLLSDYLHRQTTELGDHVDWEKLVDLGKIHQVNGILFVQCRSHLEADPSLAQVYATLKKDFGLAARSYLNNDLQFQSVRSALTSENIPFIPIKGPMVAQYYPDPALRTMGDIDLVIRLEDKEAVCRVMRKLGYSNTVSADNELHFQLQNTVFEMHVELFQAHGSDAATICDYFSGIWEHASPWNNSSEFHLDQNYHFLYLIAHIAMHLKLYGIGFRQFYDIAVLIQNSPQGYFNWDVIRKEAEVCGLLRFLCASLALISQWFQVLSPLPEAEISEELAREVTRKVFSDGVFGFSNQENSINKLESHRRRSRAPLFLLKIRTLRKLVFPPYHDLIVSNKYRHLVGRKYLLPYFWIKRLFLATQKKRRLESLTVMISADDQAVEKRHRFLRDLGL